MVLFFAGTVLSVFAGGGQQAASGGAAGDVYTVGAFQPLTGANAGAGQIEQEGVDLAYEMYPTFKLGGKDYKVNLIKADNKSDKVEAANAVQRLIDSDHIQILLGSWGSSFSIAAGPIVQTAEIPAVGISCTNPLVTLGNPWYFRVCFIDPFQGLVMANYAYNNVKARNAVIVTEVSNDYSVGLSKFFSDQFTKLGGKILGTVNFQTDDRDFSAQLTSIKNLNPDVIFAPGNFTECALLITQARQLGITTQFLGGDVWEIPEFLSIGKEAVEGCVFSSFFDAGGATSGIAKTFVDAYRAKYNKDPAAVTALGFDAYRLAIDAVQRAGTTDPVKVRDALAATKNFDGVTGNTTLDANGDATKSAYLKRVKDGKFTFETIVNP
jgi:branched-chain amino acid transport system substrate-binding protein